MNINGGDLVSILIVVGFFIVPVIAGGFATLLKHREKMRKLQAENRAEDKRLEALEQRVKELEATCAKLNERVTDAHILLSDETRQLDVKLNRMLPPEDSAEKESSKPRQAERQRVG